MSPLQHCSLMKKNLKCTSSKLKKHISEWSLDSLRAFALGMVLLKSMKSPHTIIDELASVGPCTLMVHVSNVNIHKN